MADERDFELLDDYLTNRLSEGDRLQFEHRLQADPDLQHEYALQRKLIQGIKDVRVAELKAMLNQVPVPSHHTGNGLGSKVLIGAVVSIMIAAPGYFYFSGEQAVTDQPVATEQQQQSDQAETPVVEVPAPEETAPEPKESSPVVKQQPTVEADKNQTSAGTEHSRPSLAKRPDPLQAPTGPPSGNARTEITAAQTISDDGQHSFHYRITNGQIALYGPFSQGNYEIVRFPDQNGEVLALFHRDNVYVLSDSSGQITPLSPVTDAELARQLREFRQPQ